MAWTSPSSGAEFSVGELVTAAKMNTKITDNLRYLKGLDGNVGIGSATFTAASLLHLHDTNVAGATMTFSSAAPGFAFQDNAVTASRTMAGGLGFGTSAGHFAGGAGDMNFYTLALAGGQANGIRFSTASDTSGGYASRMFVTGGNAAGAGRLGINQDAPQGQLHTRGPISGFIKWEYDGLAGTAQTVIPDGAGDVLYGLTYWAIVRGSGGSVVPSTNSAGTAIAPGGTANITVGADTVQVQVAANGAVTVQRTAGSQTHKVSLICQWL